MHTSCSNSQSETSVCDGPSFGSCQHTAAEFLTRASGADAAPEETPPPPIGLLGFSGQTRNVTSNGRQSARAPWREYFTCSITAVWSTLSQPHLFKLHLRVAVAMETIPVPALSAASPPPRVYNVKNMNLKNGTSGLFGSIVITGRRTLRNATVICTPPPPFAVTRQHWADNSRKLTGTKTHLYSSFVASKCDQTFLVSRSWWLQPAPPCVNVISTSVFCLFSSCHTFQL